MDGFFADAQGAIYWQALSKEFDAYSVELPDAVDTLIFGRATREQMKAWTPALKLADTTELPNVVVGLAYKI